MISYLTTGIILGLSAGFAPGPLLTLVITESLQHGILAVSAFVGSFYLLLVGSKMSLAMFVGRSRTFLTAKAYIYTVKVLGVALCVLSIFLFRDGLKLAGLL
ncbi:hypothetical protein ACFL7E_00730 [Thermodesulfobacteriota bacterium]